MTGDLEVFDAQTTRALPAVQAHEAMVAQGEVTVDDVVLQRDKIRQVMEAVMKEGVHYGKVPGVNKPTLLKPGAEVLAVTFRFAPSYDSDRVFQDGGHLTVITRARLTHITTGYVIAEGEGLCTTFESKYAYRQGGRICPVCGADAIKKSKFPPKKGDYDGWQSGDPPGWYCFGRIGGCGANFMANDPRITGQDIGRVANPDLPDAWNTVLKMANKRALVAAILNGTAASDIFTQDVEDTGVVAADKHEREPDADADDPFTSADTWNKPTSWTEISARLIDRLGTTAAPVWVEEAIMGTYGVPSVKELEGTDVADAAERLAKAIHALDDADTDPFSLTVSQRPAIQAAFAAAFDGTILDGPEWRLGPDETDREPYEEWAADPPGEPIPEGGEQADLDSVDLPDYSADDTIIFGGDPLPAPDEPEGV